VYYRPGLAGEQGVFFVLLLFGAPKSAGRFGYRCNQWLAYSRITISHRARTSGRRTEPTAREGVVRLRSIRFLRVNFARPLYFENSLQADYGLR